MSFSSLFFGSFFFFVLVRISLSGKYGTRIHNDILVNLDTLCDTEVLGELTLKQQEVCFIFAAWGHFDSRFSVVSPTFNIENYLPDYVPFAAHRYCCGPEVITQYSIPPKYQVPGTTKIISAVIDSVSEEHINVNLEVGGVSIYNNKYFRYDASVRYTVSNGKLARAQVYPSNKLGALEAFKPVEGNGISNYWYGTGKDISGIGDDQWYQWYQILNDSVRHVYMNNFFNYQTTFFSETCDIINNKFCEYSIKLENLDCNINNECNIIFGFTDPRCDKYLAQDGGNIFVGSDSLTSCGGIYNNGWSIRHYHVNNASLFYYDDTSYLVESIFDNSVTSLEGATINVVLDLENELFGIEMINSDDHQFFDFSISSLELPNLFNNIETYQNGIVPAISVYGEDAISIVPIIDLEPPMLAGTNTNGKSGKSNR